MSQLALSHEAGVTPRHVSFVESGRANPSREMVLRSPARSTCRCASATSCCSPPATRRSTARPGSTPTSMAQVRAALDRVLRHHEPYPAVVMDRHWDVLAANDAADALFGWLLDGAAPARTAERRAADVRPGCARTSPTGSRPARRSSSASTARRSAACPTPRPCGCSTRCSRSPASPAAWRAPDFAATPLPVLPVEFAQGRAGAELLLARHDGRDAAGRHAAGAPARVALPADARTEEHRWGAAEE